MELDFGSWTSTLGVLTLSLCAAMLLLLGVGLILAFILRQLPDARVLGGSVVCLAMAWFLTTPVLEDLGRFRTIAITSDGTWRLRNTLGWTLAEVGPQEPLRQEVRQQQVGRIRKSTQRFVTLAGMRDGPLQSVHAELCWLPTQANRRRTEANATRAAL